MSEGSGFTSMADARATGEVPEIGIGMLGYAFMGKAHSNAFLKIPHMMYPPPAIPKLVGVAGRNAEAVQEAARRFGYAHAYTDWREMLANDEVQLFDNGGPNDAHAEPCIAAAQAGKHILCEKPLGRTAEESKMMLEAVQKAGVKHMVAFNYRFVPAIRQIRKLIDSGAIGEDLSLPRHLSAGVDYAPLQHADDLAFAKGAGGQWRAGRFGRTYHRPRTLFGG